MNKLQTLNN